MKNPIKKGLRTLTYLCVIFSIAGVWLANTGNKIGMLIIFFAFVFLIGIIVNWSEGNKKDFYDF